MTVHRTTQDAVEAQGLGKRFGALWAVREVDLTVPRGSVLGLLGPNGAGKTTTVRMLTTLLRPDEGHARVAGFDVVADERAVRARLGLAGQAATVDPLLSGRANLELVTRLHHIPRAEARRRADELLERFRLTDAADRTARTYSGGMRRRLDLAASLVVEPEVLFLDEPTTGLDPRSRNELWDVLRDLTDRGTTIVLTTQYLEEADRLADHIVVIDHGRVIAQGTPQALKDTAGGARVVIGLDDPALLPCAAWTLQAVSDDKPAIDADQRRVTITLDAGTGLGDVVRALDAAGLPTDDLAVRRPTLDDVFLTLTGHDAEDDRRAA